MLRRVLTFLGMAKETDLLMFTVNIIPTLEKTKLHEEDDGEYTCISPSVHLRDDFGGDSDEGKCEGGSRKSGPCGTELTVECTLGHSTVLLLRLFMPEKIL